jgi:hypothetical protein
MASSKNPQSSAKCGLKPIGKIGGKAPVTQVPKKTAKKKG